jgi:methylenetetrahydrofolate reductase (NADPH)
MNTAIRALAPSELKKDVVNFIAGASTEIAPHDEDLLPALTAALPAGTTLYVAHTPKAKLNDLVRIACKIESLGFRASPHIVARRLESEQALNDALRALRNSGVEQVLLVAGDLERPLGPFASTLEMLDHIDFAALGFKRLGVGGHPEGHRLVSPSALWDALRKKEAVAGSTGIQAHIVTQFSFSPNAICLWDKGLQQNDISLPVHIGVAGPTSLRKLIKFAVHCGVGQSLNAVIKKKNPAGFLGHLATTPDEMLLGILRERRTYHSSRLKRLHFYAFGGSIETARWMRAIAEGQFEIEPNGNRILVNN